MGGSTKSIMKVAVKHFFKEKEVASTLVMDSLYSGLKALVGRTSRANKGKLNDAEEIPTALISMDNDMLVLVDDILLLLEKGPQNRTKDGSSGEDSNKDSIERDERHLMELGCRAIETFALSHIFSKIEVAYQEYLTEESVVGNAKAIAAGEISDLSDSIDSVSEVLKPESEDRDASPVRNATDRSEVDPPLESYTSRVILSSDVQKGLGGKTPSVKDDSSFTCCIDSVPSVVMSGLSEGGNKSQNSVCRTCDGSPDVGYINSSKNCKTVPSGPQAICLSENSKILEQHQAKGEEDQEKRNAKIKAVAERPTTQDKSVPPSPINPSKDPASATPFKSNRKTSTALDPIQATKQVPEYLKQDAESAPPTISSKTDNLVNRSVPFKPPVKPSALLIPASVKVSEMASASQAPSTTQKRESSQLPVSSSHSYLQSPVQAPAVSPVYSERTGLNPIRPSSSFELGNHDFLNFRSNSDQIFPPDGTSLRGEIRKSNGVDSPVRCRYQDALPAGFPVVTDQQNNDDIMPKQIDLLDYIKNFKKKDIS